MAVAVVSPALPVVSVAEARSARIFGGDDSDQLIEMLLSAAQSRIDGPDGWYGWAIGLQTLRLEGEQFISPPTGALIRLPYPPLVEVTAIEYTAPGGEAGVVPVGDVAVIGSLLTLRQGKAWPATSGEIDAVRITYRAGYATPPAHLKYAIMLSAGALRAAAPEGSALRKEIVEGIGTKEWALPEGVINRMRAASDSLLENRQYI